MTQDEFEIGFSRLTQAFTIQKPEDKAKIYFEELSSITQSTWMECVRYFVRKGERFPTIAAILSMAQGIDSRDQHTLSAPVNCILCDGHGWVVIERTAFRSRCGHSQGLSEKIPLAPATWRNEPLPFDPVAALKGLLALTDGTLEVAKRPHLKSMHDRVLKELDPFEIADITHDWKKNKTLSFGKIIPMEDEVPF